ncbi:metallophosphoesterase family protein [Baaleninema simplex]|uniref:metallophosphoesterase family protein n=1 Tax=Baaleninema simplex TaxID=2862350 RepID=UPI000346D109|nr:metallophosphoesterase [Baaleninema simplex]
MRRRQLFVLGGSLFGLGVGVAVRKAFAPPKLSPSTPKPVATPSPEPATIESLRSPVGPDGMLAPRRGDVRIVVVSDLNSQYGSTTYEPQVDRAVELLPDWEPDLVICSGDMVAGQDPFLTESEIRAMWDAFDRHLRKPIRNAGFPFGFTLGNHDASGVLANGAYLYDTERELAREYWQNPDRDTGLNFVDRSGFPFYYSFTQNDIFYLVWDASTSKIPAEQLAWAEKSLSEDVAKQAKLRIAIGHLPLYAIAIGRDELGEIVANAEDVRSLLERHRVRTYISGHHHAYFPGRRGELELLHAGALGSGPRMLLDGALSPTHTLTVVDINFAEEITRYTTYDMKTLEAIDPETLPRIIVGPNGWVLRRDVTWESLTPEEQNKQYVPIE